MKPDSYTINSLSKLSGLDRRTVEKRLRLGKIPKAETYRLADILGALCASGDVSTDEIREARLQNVKAKTRLLKLREVETRRELVQMAEAEAMIRTVLLPVRDLLLSAPTVLAARVNPADPEHARAQLQAWVDNGLKVLRDHNSEEPKPCH